MECDAAISKYRVPMKCKHCSMNLCDTCYAKHGGLCAWCYRHVPAKYFFMDKFFKMFLGLAPVLLLFLPAPMPMVFLFLTNPAMIGYYFLYLFIALVVLGICKKNATSNLAKRVPPGTENLDLEDEKPAIETPVAQPREALEQDNASLFWEPATPGSTVESAAPAADSEPGTSDIPASLYSRRPDVVDVPFQEMGGDQAPINETPSHETSTASEDDSPFIFSPEDTPLEPAGEPTAGPPAGTPSLDVDASTVPSSPGMVAVKCPHCLARLEVPAGSDAPGKLQCPFCFSIF